MCLIAGDQVVGDKPPVIRYANRLIRFMQCLAISRHLNENLLAHLPTSVTLILLASVGFAFSPNLSWHLTKFYVYFNHIFRTDFKIISMERFNLGIWIILLSYFIKDVLWLLLRSFGIEKNFIGFILLVSWFFIFGKCALGWVCRRILYFVIIFYRFINSFCACTTKYFFIIF